MALPDWPGADGAYRLAYQLLARVNAEAYAVHHAQQTKLPKRDRVPYAPSEDVRDWINALDKGDENDIKAYNMRYLT